MSNVKFVTAPKNSGRASTMWPAVFADGVVCRNEHELDMYLLGVNGHLEIPFGENQHQHQPITPEGAKSMFDSEQEANEFKRVHQLFQRVVEPIEGTGKWALNFPLKAHISVKDGVPADMREHKGSLSNYIEQPEEEQDKLGDPKNILGQVAAKPFYIWANHDCDNKTDSFKEAKAIRLELFNDGGESVHIVDTDGVEVVDGEIEAHEALVNAGYFAGARKPDVKPEFPGVFMVRDLRDLDGFAFVGDDIASLILETRDRVIELASDREVTNYTDPANMNPAWSNEHCEAAQREGWDIFDTHGSDDGPWQVQRFDDASEIHGGPQLKDDETAWQIVILGTAAHHEAARQFIRTHSPKEWAALNQREVQKFASGDWTHLFGVGSKETRCRIVIDLEQSKLIAAQEWTGLKFEDVRADRLKDLAESVIEVNEAHAILDDWNLELTSELPAWANQREVSNYTHHQLTRIAELDAAIDAAEHKGDEDFFNAVAAKDDYIEAQGIDRDLLETTGREVHKGSDESVQKAAG